MNIMIFDLETTGHHAGYILHLLRYWPNSNTTLILVISPEFLEQHDDVVCTETQAAVIWCPITADEVQWYKASKYSLIRHTWAEWQLFCRYATRVNADQGLVMYVDRFQLPLALRLPLPCPLSGIYFRPKFHYTQLEHHRPVKGERLKSLREQFLWRSALRHPKHKTLCTLDPFAVEPLRQLGGQTQVIHLPDPIEIYPPLDNAISLKQELDIDPQRKVFLLFGVLDKRKGIYQILDALQRLPESQQRQITLLLVGPLANADKELVQAKVSAITRDTPAQIIIYDQFVTEKDIQPYFAMADVVLAPYQRHVGMSGIVVRAAAAGKPVLASDYGLMGALVRNYSLGIAIDSTKVSQIGQGFNDFLKQTPNSIFDTNSASCFAQAHSPKQFVKVLSQKMLR